jgi:hypothetical protein
LCRPTCDFALLLGVFTARFGYRFELSFLSASGSLNLAGILWKNSLRAFVDGFRRAGAFLGVGFFTVAFLIALRGAVAEADFFLGLVLPRLDAETAFVFETRFFPPRAFFVLPVRVSTKAVTALEATFITASTFALAASAIASCAGVLTPSFSLSIIASFLTLSGKRHPPQGSTIQQQKLCRSALTYPGD